MLRFDLANKLENYLNKYGYSYSFCYEDRYNPMGSLEKLSSFTLQSITGLLNSLILENDDESRNYDIDLINRLTSLLIDSKDEDFLNIAWNTFVECAYDERFILCNEMQKALDVYFDNLDNLKSNHTKTMETDRLIIKPNCKEDAKELTTYIDENDAQEYRFSRFISHYEFEGYVIFNLVDKDTGSLIGSIGLDEVNREKGEYNLSYYIKKEYRKNGYIKEAISRILDCVVKKEIVIYGEFKRKFVMEEIKPEIHKLFIYCDKNNIASYNIAKSFGFKYDGLYNDSHYFSLILNEEKE